jgi:hypothetical protein
MRFNYCIAAGLLATSVLAVPAFADERHFTYVYEPETLPQGAMEFENWVTLGSQRNSYVGQDNYNQWDLRQELEYGVSDRYSVALYLNERSESYRDPQTQADQSSFTFQGVSIENRYMVLNPADHMVGLTAYLEGRYSGDQAEIEAKLILGQRFGLWKWALNLGTALEWEDNLSKREGEVEASLGLARELGKYWSLGLELVSNSILPDYRTWENSALFLGPVVAYHQEKWWAALTVLPQIYGWNSTSAPDGNSHLELIDHEKINIRLLFGFNF